MPMKCMDHTPMPPSATPTVRTLERLWRPPRWFTRPAAVRATKEPMTAKAKDKATSSGSKAVVTVGFMVRGRRPQNGGVRVRGAEHMGFGVQR